MTETTARYRKNPATAGRVIEGMAFIITPEDSKLHTLNTTASHLWELARDGFTLEQAAGALAARFDVDEITAHADVKECVEDLVARQILVAE
jgi:hypothetical protein